MKYSIKQQFIDFIEAAVISSLVILLVYAFAGQPLRVQGSSMVPNFTDGEQLIAEKITIKTEELKRGDIVIVKHPARLDRLVIKRVVGLPNEVFLIKEGLVYINGASLNENYLPTDVKTLGGEAIKESVEYQIPKGDYILMGDNRENSTDSRNWGALKKDLIVGKAFVIYYPLSKARLIS